MVQASECGILLMSPSGGRWKVLEGASMKRFGCFSLGGRRKKVTIGGSTGCEGPFFLVETSLEVFFGCIFVFWCLQGPLHGSVLSPMGFSVFLGS